MKVGIVIARRALYVENLHACEHADALYQIDGGDHAAFHAEFFFVIFQRGFRSFPPEPYGIGGALARRDPRKVDGMIFQKFVGAAHHAQKFFLQFPLGKMTAHGALRNVVGRRKIVSRFAPVDDKAVTITHAAVQRKFFVVEKRFQIFDQFFRLAGGNFPRAVIDHAFIFVIFLVGNGHEIAAHGNVGAAKGNADGNRFQRRAPRIALFGIVTEHGKIRHVAAGLHAVGHGLAHTDLTAGGKRVEIGRTRAFERRFIAQVFQFSVRHAVAEHNYVFHDLTSLFTKIPVDRLYAVGFEIFVGFGKMSASEKTVVRGERGGMRAF